MRLENKLKLTTLIYSEERFFNGRLSRINCGDCWMWALIAERILRGTAKVCTAIADCDGGPGHVFIKFGSLYYDSECIYGTSNWENLNFFRRASSEYTFKFVENNKRKYILRRWGRYNGEIAKKACRKATLQRYLFRDTDILTKYTTLDREKGGIKG